MATTAIGTRQGSENHDGATLASKKKLSPRATDRGLQSAHASPARLPASPRPRHADGGRVAGPYRGQELHCAGRPAAQHQGHQPRQLADARGLHVQVRGRQIAAPDLRRLRPPSWPRACGRLLDRIPRHLHRARRHPLHQVGWLQYRAHPAALPPVHDRPGRDRGRGLGAARSRAGLGARSRTFRHRRPACRARRPDRHQPRRRAGISADVLCAARPRAHGQAMARHRPALQRRSGDPGLRHPERTDRALSRHGDAQHAAGAVLQAGDRRRSARSIPAGS